MIHMALIIDVVSLLSHQVVQCKNVCMFVIFWMNWFPISQVLERIVGLHISGGCHWHAIADHKSASKVARYKPKALGDYSASE